MAEQERKLFVGGLNLETTVEVLLMKSTASKPGLRNSILNAVCQDTSVTYLMVVRIMYDFSKTKQ
jgi:hypothetical protein